MLTFSAFHRAYVLVELDVSTFFVTRNNEITSLPPSAFYKMDVLECILPVCGLTKGRIPLWNAAVCISYTGESNAVLVRLAVLTRMFQKGSAQVDALGLWKLALLRAWLVLIVNNQRRITVL